MTQETPYPNAMRFRLLGPLEHRIGEEWMPVKAAKQRALLALLLLNANRIVAADQLINQLWGDQPPSSASTLVAGYVWRLRRAMKDPSGTMLITRSPGYLLALPDGGLDVQVYESLVSAGRRSLALRRSEEAVDAFGRALALWRDAPMADVPLTSAVMAESARLDESRLAVAELRMGTWIDLGHDEELLPELKLMVAQHPLRERLHGYLMVALYRAGQQADALGTYRDLRRLLIDELGVEPSRPLQELQRRILREDEDLLSRGNGCESLLTSGGRAGRLRQSTYVGVTTPVSVDRTDIAVGPGMSSPPSGALLGHDDEVRHFAQRLRGRAGVFAVRGGFGTGKSAFAMEVARAVADDYPDGQLCLDLRHTGTRPSVTALGLLATVARAMRRSLGGPVDEPYQLAAQWHAVTAGRRLLLVLDHVDDDDQVRALVTPTPTCAVLLTGPSTVGAVDGLNQVHLRRLSARHAVAILRTSLGDDRIDAHRGAAAAVARYCEHLPLALRAAALQLAARPEWSIVDLARRLRDPAQRLNLLNRDDISVRESLHRGVQFLRREGRAEAVQALGLLAAIDLPVVPLHLVAALLGCSVEGADKVVGWLLDAGLVDPIGDDRYRVSDLLRLYAAEVLQTDPRPARRVVDYYLEVLGQHVSVLREPHVRPGDRYSTIAWFRRERPVLELLARRPDAGRLARHLCEFKALVNVSQGLVL